MPAPSARGPKLLSAAQTDSKRGLLRMPFGRAVTVQPSAHSSYRSPPLLTAKTTYVDKMEDFRGNRSRTRGRQGTSEQAESESVPESPTLHRNERQGGKAARIVFSE